MQLTVEVNQSTAPTASPAEPSRGLIFGPFAADDGPRLEPARRPYSFTSECECPYDCLRDHDNE